MEYIDIDSTYRNRNEYPKQAQFTVVRQQQHACLTNERDIFKKDPVSLESVLFPNPQVNPPLAFYEETLHTPLNTIVSRENLPFMFSTDTPTIVQLDELVLASTDSTTTSVTENALYPRGSIPLGQANEFYTGDVLEDVANNEFRLITAFRYDDDIDNVFQTGIVQNAVTFANGDAFITINPESLIQNPFSNVDRFYQGKFLKMLSGNATGTSKLITNYTATTLSQYTFQLESSFGVSISPGDTFAIVSDRKWFATIESPFTNSPPSYPCFRNVVPTQVSWSPAILSEEFSNVEYLRIYQQGFGILGAQNMAIDILVDNGTNSLAGDDLGNISHLISNDQNGQYGFTNIFTRTNVILKTHFGSAYTQTTDPLVITNSYTPKIIYAEASTTVANNWSVRLLTAYDENGLSWDDSEVLGSYTSGSVIQQNISATASTDGSLLFGAWSVYNGVDYDLVFYNGSSTSVIVNEATEIQTIDLALIDDIPAIIFAFAGNLYSIHATDSSGNSWGSSYAYPLVAVNTNILDYNLAEIDTTGSGDFEPYSMYVEDGNTGVQLAYGIDPNNYLVDSSFINELSINGGRILQADINGNNFPIILLRDSFNQRLWILLANKRDPGIGSSNNEENFNTLQLLDSNVVGAIDMTRNFNNQPIIVYTRLIGSTTELVSLNLSIFITSSCTSYRIRKSANVFSGGPFQNAITSSSSSSITLPSSLDIDARAIKGSYLHLTDFDLYQVFSPSFNNFLFIENYDPTTQILTFTPRLTSTLSDVVATNYSDFSALALLFTDSSMLGKDFSPNIYNFPPGTGTSYASSYTDTNGLTLTNLLQITAGPDPRGLERTFTSSEEYINSVLKGNQISISLWFLLDGFDAGQQQIFRLEDLGTRGTDIAVLLDGTLEFSTSSGDVFFQAQYPGIIADTWYHVVYVHTQFGITAYLNNEDITSSLIFVTGNKFTPYPNNSSYLLDFIRIGRFLNYDGYIKDVIYTGQPFSRKQVQSIYDSTFNRVNYVNWEILGDMVDQFQPLNYVGSSRNSQMVCTELELTRLILPNAILKTGNGNRIAFYPYVYVEFSNRTNIDTKHFYSNNPNTTRVLFKVPIEDRSTPEIATFVNNKSNMTIITRFNPNDNFNFTVYLPNGEVFETLESDTMPPLPPSSLLQLSATFGFKFVHL